MQKIVLTIALLFGLFAAQAQTNIGLTASKEIGRTNGKWDSWPANWKVYASEGKVNPNVQITTVGDPEDEMYNLKYSVGGFVLADLTVIYDSELSGKIRKQWNDQYVNCYMANTGNYIYLQGVSLEMLANDSSAWRTNSRSCLYIWMPDKNKAIIVK